MYRTYAHDPAMRINLGIRRRLAPLLHNNRQKIELMNGLLCSLPGTPGPLLRRRDRDGRQRLPRRPRRRAHADAVERRPQRRASRRRTRSSCTCRSSSTPSTTTRRSTSRRSSTTPSRCCGGCAASSRCASAIPCSAADRSSCCRPTTTACSRSCAAIAAPVHDQPGQQVLVVANLSRHPQYVELDLSEFRGLRPIELFGQTSFPPIGELPVPADARAARVLLARARAGARPIARPTERPCCPSLDGAGRVDVAVRARPARSALDAVLPRLLRSRRWFGAKGRRVHRRAIDDVAEIPLPFLWSDDEDSTAPRPARLVVRARRVPRRRTRDVRAARARSSPVAPASGSSRTIRPPRSRSSTEPRGEPGVLVDAHWLPGYGHALLVRRSARRRRSRTERGSVVGVPGASATPCAREAGGDRPSRVHVLRGEQSNTSLVFDERVHPEDDAPARAGREPRGRDRARPHRTGRASRHAPPLAGALEYRTGPGRARRDARGAERVRRRTRATRTRWFPDALARFFDEALVAPRRTSLGPAAGAVRRARSRRPRGPDATSRRSRGGILAAGRAARAARRRAARRARVRRRPTRSCPSR